MKPQSTVTISKNKKNKLIIEHKNKHGDVFSCLSGAEEFAFNLATVTALGQMSEVTNSSILYIDEGFTALDTQKLGEINEVFTHLKTMFHFVINISHLDSIHEYSDYKIEVNDGAISTNF